MRIIQIIDSLEAGGAEKMAVNYANILAEKISFSGIVATRSEGILKEQLTDKVNYLFLHKKRSFDIQAVFRLKKYIKTNKVSVVHAHSSSFFIAFLVKCVCPSIQLIWHDHYGNSEFLNRRPRFVLQLVLPFFKGILCVNKQLEHWLTKELNCKNVLFLPNFILNTKPFNTIKILKGKDDKRILCLANLRPQKNHNVLLEVACLLKETHPDWSFHFVGKDFNDEYSQEIKNKIEAYKLQQHVYLYGSQQDVASIILESTIGVLSSLSEGMPVALLEYGWFSKPVVVTAVGDIPLVIENNKNGFLISDADTQEFYQAILKLIENKKVQEDFGNALHLSVEKQFSTNKVIATYLNWLQNI